MHVRNSWGCAHFWVQGPRQKGCCKHLLLVHSLEPHHRLLWGRSVRDVGGTRSRLESPFAGAVPYTDDITLSPRSLSRLPARCAAVSAPHVLRQCASSSSSLAHHKQHLSLHILSTTPTVPMVYATGWARLLWRVACTTLFTRSTLHPGRIFSFESVTSRTDCAVDFFAPLVRAFVSARSCGQRRVAGGEERGAALGCAPSFWWEKLQSAKLSAEFAVSSTLVFVLRETWNSFVSWAA